MREIKIVIKKGNKIEVEVNGVTGGACKDLTAKLEQSLGGGAKVEEKADYWRDGVVEGEYVTTKG